VILNQIRNSTMNAKRGVRHDYYHYTLVNIKDTVKDYCDNIRKNVSESIGTLENFQIDDILKTAEIKYKENDSISEKLNKIKEFVSEIVSIKIK
jgi:hypothetical protein